MVLIHIQSERMLRLYSGQHGFRGKIEIMKKKRLTVNDWVLTSLSYMMIFLGRLVPGAGRIVAGVWPLPCVGPQVRLQRLLPRKHPAIKKTFYLLNICFKWPIHNSHATVRNAHLGITPIQCRYTAEYRYLIVSNFQNIGKNLLNLEFLLKTAWKGSGTQKLLIIIRKYRKKG